MTVSTTPPGKARVVPCPECQDVRGLPCGECGGQGRLLQRACQAI